MSNIVISVESLSKTYRLGQIGTGTFSNDLKVWWAKMRGKPNPMLRIGEKDYGNRDGEELWALRDVSFTVQQGEVLGIIGRNGAGKSTLLKILSRVTAPTSGKIKVKGRIASLLEVGTGFHPELTGRENIYLNGAILGMTKQEVTHKFDEIVDFSEVKKFIDTPVKRYSSGMYVRLAFAVAAHLEPEILIVDEVLAVGDAEFQKKCLGKMGDVAKEGRTVLFVSHNMKAIEGLCNLCSWFDNGRLLKVGKSNEIIKDYLNSGILKESIKVNTNELRFICIVNRNELDNLSPLDDLNFVLEFLSGENELNRISIDLALLNERDEWVLHLQSRFITPGFRISPDQKVKVDYLVKSPKLSPGHYRLILYVYDEILGKPIVWIEELDACNVLAKNNSYFGSSSFFDGVKAAILPEYSIGITNESV